MRKLQQLSWTTMQMEKRFPEIEYATEQEMITYIRRNLALKYDIEDILQELNGEFKKYGKTES